MPLYPSYLFIFSSVSQNKTGIYVKINIVSIECGLKYRSRKKVVREFIELCPVLGLL